MTKRRNRDTSANTSFPSSSPLSVRFSRACACACACARLTLPAHDMALKWRLPAELVREFVTTMAHQNNLTEAQRELLLVRLFAARTN